MKYPTNRRQGHNYPVALRPCIEQPFDSFLENLSNVQLTPAVAAYCLQQVDQSSAKSDNAPEKVQTGTTLLSDPYSLHFVITLSQAQEPENLLETLLAGLTNVYSLNECRKINIEEDLALTEGEQVLGLRSHEVDPGDFEFDWQRVPETVSLSSDLLAKARAGHIHVKSDEDNKTFWFPIMHSGKCRSVLALTTREALEPHLAKIRALLEIYANLNFILDQAQKDKLTGLLNRQTFDSKISRMLEKQRTTHSDYSAHHEERRHAEELQKFPWLAIIDIDHFKLVNDQYGHLYGDEVILTIGQILKQSFRRSDLLFRFGGEEFVVLLEPIPAANVEYALERLRRTVENQNFQQVGRVSVSIGYAKFVENMFPPMIIDRADQALYFAKNNGRNQVANYEALVDQGKLDALDHKEGSIDLF